MPRLDHTTRPAAGARVVMTTLRRPRRRGTAR